MEGLFWPKPCINHLTASHLIFTGTMKIRHYYPQLYKRKKKFPLSILFKVTILASNRVRKNADLAVSKDFMLYYNKVFWQSNNPNEIYTYRKNADITNEISILVKNYHISLLGISLLLFLLQEFTRKVLLKEPGKAQAMTFGFHRNEGK